MTAVPKVGRAAPATNIGTMDYKITCTEEYPVPEPKPHEVLVKLEMSGVCQSDHHFVCGDWGIPMGVDCTGHEGAGEVVALGSDVKGWKIGERVGITPVSNTCEKCEYCLMGKETLCTDMGYVACHYNGCYAQYLVIPAQWAIKLPDNVPMEQLAPFMCSGGTAYTAVKAAELKKGQYVVVMGAGGGVGHMVTQFAKAQGLNVIGVDIGADKEATAREAGAAEFVDLGKTADAAEEVKKYTDGKGAHGVIVAVGSGKAYTMAPTLLRNAGTVVAVGLPPAGTAFAGAEPGVLCFRGIQVRGILVTTRKDMVDALKFLENGSVKEHVTLLPFAKFPEALAAVANSTAKGRQVIDFNA